jgi:hypothetical protein
MQKETQEQLESETDVGFMIRAVADQEEKG